MKQLTRYFMSRILGRGSVTAEVTHDERSEVAIRCEAISPVQEVRYLADLARRGSRALSPEDALYRACRCAIARLQQEVYEYRPGDAPHVLDLSATPWNGDLHRAPVRLVSERTLRVMTRRSSPVR